MNLLDIIIVAVLAFCLIRGIVRGFLKELLSLIVLITSIIISNHYQPLLSSHFFTILPKGRYIPLISFAFLFVCSYIGLSIIAWAIRALLFSGPVSGGFSRVLGATIGTLRAIIVVYLFIVLLTFFIPSKTPLIARSNFAPIIIKSYQSMIVPISPSFFKKFKQKFALKIKKIKKEISK